MKISSQKWAGSFSKTGYGCRANSTRASLDTPASTANGSRFVMAGMFMVIRPWRVRAVAETLLAVKQ